MIKKNLSVFRSILVFIMLIIFAEIGYGQTVMPPELSNNSIKEQLNYLEQKTRIYEFYRAIREDMFQKIKINVNDTLAAAGNSNMLLRAERSVLKSNIDSLTALLETTKISLEEMTKTKNSIKVLGLEVNKTSYNSTMWIIVAGLLGILALGFLAFKRNLIVTGNTRKELEDLKNEFEAYRKTTREAREKMSMAHFLEIKKLKGEK
ncbi:MAG: hypothetical protein IPJ16_03740 [Bacteroidales bacterium]|nr:hypothetical protein [Bacteroidales bacterium]